jgi:hypothetical protein
MKALSILLVLSIVVTAGCGRKEKKEQAADAERLKQLGDKAEVLVDSGKLQDADKLKGLLPKTLPNMKRLEATAKKLGSIGRRLTRGEVSFEGADGELVEMSITDAVSAKGLAAIPDSEWTTKDVKEDTDTRFVSVENKDGRRMYKEYNLNTRQGKVRVLAGNRFVVEIVGLNMKFEDVETLLSTIPVGTLEKLAAGK